jgi:hypothetical protein
MVTMRYLLVAIMMTVASPAFADGGDLALRVVDNGWTLELAQTACDEGDQTGCIFAHQSRDDQAEVTELLVEVIHDSQATCANDPGGNDCELLKQMDRQAKKVLVRHGILQPGP